jgi:hypothetical protein
MKIYQIIIGEIPEYLVACVESVKSWCKRSGNEYKQIATIPDHLNCVPDTVTTYFRNRLIKDWVVLDLLSSEPETIVIDWDIFLYSQFSFVPGKYPAFAGWPMDCMMYNSNNTSVFLKMKELTGDIKSVQPGELLLSKVISLYRQENPSFKYVNFNNKQYKHLDNCRLEQ